MGELCSAFLILTTPQLLSWKEEYRLVFRILILRGLKDFMMINDNSRVAVGAEGMSQTLMAALRMSIL